MSAMRYFYSNQILDDRIDFEQEEAMHIIKSMRRRSGERIEVLDGLGHHYTCILQLEGRNNAWGQIVEKRQLASDRYQLHLALAPTKNQARFETFVEKATELGVHAITPVLSAKSEKPKIKADRLARITISAIKQSGNGYLPRVNPTVRFADFMDQVASKECKFIAHCHTSGLPHLGTLITPQTDGVVMIGPEGDFSLEEVLLAKEKGFTEISLGSRRLRTETAGILVSALYSIENQKL